MCAFLALSLVGTNLYAYALNYTVTPSRFACVLKNAGHTDADISKTIPRIIKNGLPLKTKAGNTVLFNFKEGTFMDSFVTADGKTTATFADVLYDADGTEKEKKAIQDGTDTCATAYAVSMAIT